MRRRGGRRWFTRQGISLIGIVALVAFIATVAAAVVYVYLKVRAGAQ
jgi:hypothetical protein